MTEAAGGELALETRKLTMQFGGLKAVSDLEIRVPRGAIFGLIGPNGAGKTTAFNMLTGVYAPTAGEVFGYGKPLVGLKPYEITKCGLARTFQNIRLFRDLTVLENLLVAMDHNPSRKKFGWAPMLFHGKKATAEEDVKVAECLKLLDIFGMRNRARVAAKNLPYGDQRRLEIARAMATGAKLLLLDEPAAGMNGQETAALMATIRKIRDDHGMTILLIEHDMKLVMGVTDRIVVLEFGKKIADNVPGVIRDDPRVIAAYLGVPEDDVA